MKPFSIISHCSAISIAAALIVAAAGADAAGQDDLDRQLLESLEGEQQQDSPVTMVNRLLENTETARERLEAGKLDEQTSTIQQQILDDIDALLANSGDTPPGSPPAGSPQPQSQGEANSSQSGQQQGKVAGQTAEAGEQTAPSNDPNAISRESNERTQPGEETAAGRERRLDLATAVWGHLPPKVREQMRSAFSETYLPEYDELVRLYYEALAARRATRDEPVNPSSP